MAVGPRTNEKLEYRIDHSNLGEVKRVHFEVATLKDFELVGQTLELPEIPGFELPEIPGFELPTATGDPAIPTGLVTVEVDGEEHTGVKLFYHCLKDWPDKDDYTDRLRENGSLVNAEWAFRAGQKVAVMFHEDKPRYVLSHHEKLEHYHTDPREPIPCCDVVKMRWKIWFSDDWQTIYLRMSDPTKVWKTLNELGVDLQGKELYLPHRARKLAGYKEHLTFTIQWYAGDWLIVIGPIAYIIQIYSMGLPLPTTEPILVEAAVWTPERHEKWLEVGREREKVLNSGLYQTSILTNIPYPDVVHQTELSNLFNNLFVGFPAPPDPNYWARWVFTEFWGYESNRPPTVEGTPNNQDG